MGRIGLLITVQSGAAAPDPDFPSGEVLTGEGVAAVEKAVDRFEHWAGTSELLDLLRAHTRTP